MKILFIQIFAQCPPFSTKGSLTISPSHASRLLTKEATEYELLSNIQKAFEPYCDLWKRVDEWTVSHKRWMNGSFFSLDAEEVNCFVAIISTSTLDTVQKAQ